MKPNPTTVFKDLHSSAAPSGEPREDGGVNEGPARSARKRRAPWPRRRSSFFVALFTLCLFGIGLFFSGFLVFADHVARLEPATAPKADGIVVLTGGAERIAGATDLLAKGHARRLLISGVHPSTSAKQIDRLVDAGPSLFECCIDLDRRAVNTVGNAAETAKWVRRHEFRSIIVVTSAYHMPRSMMELGSAMPGIELKPYPVMSQSQRLKEWYEQGSTMRLLFAEYLKYIATGARLALDALSGSLVIANVAR